MGLSGSRGKRIERIALLSISPTGDGLRLLIICVFKRLASILVTLTKYLLLEKTSCAPSIIA